MGVSLAVSSAVTMVGRMAMKWDENSAAKWVLRWVASWAECSASSMAG